MEKIELTDVGKADVWRWYFRDGYTMAQIAQKLYVAPVTATRIVREMITVRR